MPTLKYDLKATIHTNGYADFDVDGGGNIRVLDDPDDLVSQIVEKILYTEPQTIGYGVGIATLRGEKDTVLRHLTLQDRIMRSLAVAESAYGITLDFESMQRSIGTSPDTVSLRIQVANQEFEISV